MSTYGDTSRECCPICNKADNFGNIWKIPMTKVKEPIMLNGAKFTLMPMLNSQTIYNFSRCENCETIFLDPFNGKYWDAREDTHHARKAAAREYWASYQYRIKALAPFIGRNMDIVIDAAAGGGQCLTVMKETGYTVNRMIGIDIMPKSVEYIQSIGFDGVVGDVCKQLPVDDNTVDLIMFYEAFEHVFSPYYAIYYMAKALKPGGILSFTSQSSEGDLPIRPEECICTTYKGLEMLVTEHGLEIVHKEFSSGRWRFITRKG